MQTPILITKENYRRSTWKNGLGFTDQIAIYPPNAVLAQANFLWRLSSARIEKESPFSLFPNHDRLLIVLKGPGIKLIHTIEEGGDEEVVEIPTLEPYEFPGDIPSRCELKGAPIIDFSIFIRKAEVEPLVQIVELNEGETHSWIPEGRWNFAFAISGDFETEGGNLNEGDTLSFEQKSPGMENVEIKIRGLNPRSHLLLISLGS